jgi:integrase
LKLLPVGMCTGIRINEGAALLWDQVRERDGVPFIAVEIAKTPAGNREVPLHPAPAWLATRRKGNACGRVWPRFSPEGRESAPARTQAVSSRATRRR